MKAKAFTLMEMLVVIALIGMLTGILIPALRSVRQQGRLVVCSSNLRQLCYALAIYEQNNDSFPFGFNDILSSLSSPIPSSGYAGYPSSDSLGWWWFNFLGNIIGDDLKKGSVLWCPARSVEDPFPKPNVLCGNYGINQAICKNTPSLGGGFVGAPLNISAVRSPSQTILIMDSGYTLISWRAATDPVNPSIANPQRKNSFYVPGIKVNQTRPIKAGAETDAIDSRHPHKTVNIAFVDNHLSTVKSDDLFVEKKAKSSPFWFPN
jgi:prepilin-type N-terminal cleavage/methylation domain-containing protein/prepilin-type processing-associated H-X9-DG protein